MLTSARIESALKKLADSFLNESRTQMGTPQLSGSGQFIGQPNRSQIGLYGTCAGLIVISLAYGANRVPDSLVRYLLSLWNERHLLGSAGARNFALTPRPAFFLMAIRLSGHRDLKAADAEAEKEIRKRTLADGLFVAVSMLGHVVVWSDTTEKAGLRIAYCSTIRTWFRKSL